MKKFNKIAAQGEAFIRRIDNRPDDLIPVKSENGRHIIAHSETGHHHVMNAGDCQLLERVNVSEGMRILHLIVEKTTSLEHLRNNDTHEAIQFEPGEYEIRIQREYTPEGFRRVQD
ncbi:MAG: hypothetical protein COA52_01295 [Hyphomicrobiales bacterium]|nr:MAG: hypothetical protein COA52_00205 [Hyphomicrobiales bacterium]PCJ96867.1 MAG: hypothetical protein COA52_01295 [Hyphomicrobiales bacterium]